MQLDSIDVSRFWEKVSKTDNCWNWTGQKSEKGYGLFSVQRKRKRAHQIAYLLSVGPIPDGLQLDHLCRNKSCVNPEHLEPVTSRENTMRGIKYRVYTQGKPRKRKEFCKYGHPMSGDNLYIRPNGQNSCKTCLREAAKRNFSKESHRKSRAKYLKRKRIQKLLAKLEALGYHCTCLGSVMVNPSNNSIAQDPSYPTRVSGQ